MRGADEDGWHAGLVETVATRGHGIAELADALDAHVAHLSQCGALERRRKRAALRILTERVREQAAHQILGQLEQRPELRELLGKSRPGASIPTARPPDSCDVRNGRPDMKTLALIVRRADHSREAFRKHYEEIHSPLAMQTVMQGTSRYVKYHLREEIHGAAAFDVISAFVYRDPTAAAALFARVQGPEGERIRADEQTFMDTARNRSSSVTEEFERGTT